ncbi:GNAT family N-acetyltransferase [Pseudalkalibacillus berkeleyi]|uniref:GNAT family N-acetyltransferase n=1 Tax=Pseudalkalibacillus berkeleyi TaxID=1069813 RepID=A0ABS9GXK5_9BACL|nr:GNAT family N-acetyltransferase [Pseudalkalibacillus berkeleyi]MCF6136546.1 GNAT family N-acetyltransferase [Pseudalkalibacillus berkeleyi]
MKIIETENLILRLVTKDDAAFILNLLNDSTWIKFIGDKGVRTIEDAENYIVSGPLQMYSKYGYCLYLTELKEDRIPLGLCGLIKRDGLEDTDIGFGFLSEYQAKGYAYEAASATLEYGIKQLELKRIVAITSTDNHASSKLLEKIGMTFEKIVKLPGDEEKLKLYAKNKI